MSQYKTPKEDNVLRSDTISQIVGSEPTQCKQDEGVDRYLNSALEIIMRAGEVSIWRYNVVERKFYAMIGDVLMPDGTTYEQCADAIADDSKDDYHKLFESLLSGKVDKGGAVLHFIAPDSGVDIYYRNELTVLYDQTGEFSAIIGTQKDITEVVVQNRTIEEFKAKARRINEKNLIIQWEYDSISQVFVSDENAVMGKEMTLDDYLELVHVSDVEKVDNVCGIMREGKDESFSVDFKYITANVLKYATVAGEPYAKNSRGRVTRYLGYRKDITNTVLMTESVRDIKFKTDMAMESANMVMWEYSVEEKLFTAFNDPLTNYDITTKYSPTEYISLLDPCSVEEASQAVAFMDRQEIGEFSFKSKIMLPDSSDWQYITVHGSNSEVSEEDPTKATKYIGFRVDNSELVKLSQGLIESKDLTDSILTQSPSSIFIKDITNEWRYIVGNDLFCQLVNRTESQIVGHTDHEIFDQSVADKFHSDDITALNYDGIYAFIEDLVTVDGSVRALYTTKRVITTANSRQLLIGITSDITDTIEQQRALSEANKKSKLILDNANVGLVYIDNDFRILWENSDSISSNSFLNKYQRGTICYKNVYGLDAPCADCVIMKSKKSGKGEKQTKVLNDGTIFDVFANPVIDDSNQINGYVCRVDDVTEDVLKTRKVREIQKYLDLAISAGNLAVWGYDPKQDTVFNISGRVFEKDVLPFSEATKYLHKDDLPQFTKVWQRLVSAESDNENICMRFYSPFTGDLEYVDKSMVTLRSASGELEMIIGTHHDVTDDIMQKLALEESKVKAEESHLLLQSIIRQIPFGLYIKDVGNDFRYVIMNDVLANIDNVDSKNVIGKTDYELFDKEIADIFYEENVVTASKPDGELTVMKSHIDWHGQHSVYENSDTAITVANGRRLLVGVVADVTEREHMLSELQIAKERAEQSDQLKSAFLANMSHEIRTPLNAIVGFSELLIDAEDAAEREEYTNIISINNDLLLRLIGDILDLSKIESGMIELRAEEFDLSDIADEVYMMLKQKVTSPKIDFSVENPYYSCIVKLDKNRLTQVGINFITNAIKYTAEGMIKMGYMYVDHGIRIYVEDTGIGIAEENYDKVFQRFEKFDSFAQGTGLGLSICKAIVEAQGGKIGFESELGRGSIFWAWFPCEADITELSDSDNIDDQIDSVIDSTKSATLKNVRILIAEDNDSNYLLVKHMLKDHNVSRAKNGVEAVEMARAEQFSIILMDWKMPIMNGLDATRKIREFDKKIPIIAVTANAFDSNKLNVIEAGCNAFMSKPLKRQELLDVIAKFQQ